MDSLTPGPFRAAAGRASRAGNEGDDGSQDGPGTACDSKLGNTIGACQAEYVLEPDAMATLAAVPDDLSDERVPMRAEIMSTGFGSRERAGIRIGDTVCGFAQGPIGLYATAHGVIAHSVGGPDAGPCKPALRQGGAVVQQGGRN